MQHSDMALLDEIRACTICARPRPLGPRPVLQLSSTSRILIIGQAPGTRVHHSGVPWQDDSGRDRNARPMAWPNSADPAGRPADPSRWVLCSAILPAPGCRPDLARTRSRLQAVCSCHFPDPTSIMAKRRLAKAQPLVRRGTASCPPCRDQVSAQSGLIRSRFRTGKVCNLS